ncbi:potassium channel family protein [Aliikangiella maris]|uniref:Potassium channel family protein n=2 Tax=Aliikangiella maris TaxID=3162458 RepID=A0ABV3MK35_9GAMM
MSLKTILVSPLMLGVFIVNSLIIAIVVLIHYEILHQLTHQLPRLRVKHNFKIVIGVFGALFAHIVEVWVFALAYYVMIHISGWGNLVGNSSGSLMDCAYFSFTTYTTLGFGDIQPVGEIRYLTGIESLTGLVLVTWTASFLYYEMKSYWKEN